MTVSAQNPVMMGQSAVNLSGLGQAFTARQMGHQTVALRGLGQVGVPAKIGTVVGTVVAVAVAKDVWDGRPSDLTRWWLAAMAGLSVVGTGLVLAGVGTE